MVMPAAGIEKAPVERDFETELGAEALAHGWRAKKESGDELGAYLRQISQVALLTAEQEVDLAQRIEAGLYAENHLLAADHTERTLTEEEFTELNEIVDLGRAAKAHMIEANLKLVVHIARRYRGREVAFLDLIQIGNLGLMRAVEKFDFKKGYKFSTYATWWICEGISREIPEVVRLVRLPKWALQKVKPIRQAIEELTVKLNRSPTDREVAQVVESKKEVSQGIVESIGSIRRASYDPKYLDDPIDDKHEMGDLLLDTTDDQWVQLIINEADGDFILFACNEILANESRRNKAIVYRFLGLGGEEPLSAKELSELYGLGVQSIRKIVNRALKQLAENPELRRYYYNE